MEHLQHFALSQDPFQNEPDLRFYFESDEHVDAQRRVDRGLRQSKGLTVLTGDAGTGKSLLARRIYEGLEEEVFEASFMVAVKGAAGRGSFLGRYASQLEIDAPASEPGPLMGQIYEALAVVREDGRHAVLIVDEAHSLSNDAFSELAALLNLEYEDRRLVSLLLVGSPELDVTLNRESGLMQRVDVRTRLGALGAPASARYLEHRIRTVGGSPAILPEEAVQALYKFSRGRPRLLNTLADNALFEAFLGGRQAVSPADVKRAAADLAIGPDPGTTYTAFSGPDLAAAGAMGGAMLGELTDPGAGPSITAPSAEGMDLGAVTIGGGGGDISSLDLSPNDSDSALDLGSPLSDTSSSLEATQIADELPSFSAQSDAHPAEADVTRIALPEETIVAPAEQGDGEVDDLFAELLDD
ncbi:MAG: ExeA family protein [Myxococcota bacterium]